ncbi:MAG: hypothetical protein ACRDL6_01905 [Solirubrobacterales bacterium]
MKRIAKRIALVASLALVAGVVSAVPAQAAVSGTCGVAGQATTSPPVQLQGGSGTYEFQDLVFACEGTIDGQTDVAVFDITTDGTYVNEVCGTGEAHSTTGNGVVTQSLMGNQGKTFEAQYDIVFTAGVGTLTFRSPASGSGVIDIIATGPQAPPACTDSFAVAGEVTLNIP